MNVYSSIIDRIPMIWAAAADKEKGYPVLNGVSVTYVPRSGDDQASLVIAATDGKILIEESYEVDDDGPDRWSVILHADGVGRLRKMVKVEAKAHKSIDWKVERVAVPQTTGQHLPTYKAVVTVTDGHGSSIKLACVDGTFPPYTSAFNRPQEVPIGRFCIDMDYAAAVAKLWKQTVFRYDGRGFQIAPLSRVEGKCRGLIMPITLPQV